MARTKSSTTTASNSNNSNTNKSTKPHYEFGGPIGAIGIMIALPIVVYFLYFNCNKQFGGCISINPYSTEFLRFNNPLTAYNNNILLFLRSLFSAESFIIIIFWWSYHIILYYLLPAEIINGVELNNPINTKYNGSKLQYPLNGFSSMIVSLGTLIGLVYSNIIPATLAYDQFLQLATASIILSIILSLYLYISSILSDPNSSPASALAPHGNSGNLIYDFFIGRTLNPRIGFLDLKYICELRPGLIGWVAIIWSFAAKQYELTGSLTNSMILIIIFQTIYVIDALTSESAILTTMDITSDGFGFMLVFGDLVWVPFTYSLQARYIVDWNIELSTIQSVIILLLCIIGFTIFRGANNQKNQFRSNPESIESKSMKYLSTNRGSKLLISGWWGISRHSNYLGDLLMGLAWCLTCGSKHILPYFYSIYFTILLIHRERRDSEKCANKYGSDWDKYCSIVKYRIVPYLY